MDVLMQRSLNPQLFASIPPSVNNQRSHQIHGLQLRNKMSSSATPVQNTETKDLKRLTAQVESLQIDLARANEAIATQQRKWDKMKESVKKKRENKESAVELSLFQSGTGEAGSPSFLSANQSLYFSSHQQRDSK